ncbi:MAG TPA: MFS transporter [Acidimicrobiales bacterium]|jgi:EmrB/QacA subfamily drug resistance transporter|nr:MFS transporter [Acidimicrobiales bacterium]
MTGSGAGSEPREPAAGTAEEELAFGTARGRWVLAATVLGTGIAFLDSTVVGIALPSISRAFGGGVGTLQWVITGYSLTLAAFLLLGGSLGDRLGRRRMFSLGIAWFAVASAACGLAPTAGFLIAARVVQGIGGALLTPGSLAIIQASFRADDRSRAIGAWSGLGGVATAAGPLIGGYLLAAGSWRWIFYINLPIAIFVLIITARHVPESTDPTVKGRIDVTGASLGVVFLAGVSYALIQGPTKGWSSPLVVVALVLTAISGPAFIVVEQRAANPMLPLDLFRARQFSGANAVTFVVYGALGGALFLLPVELQVVAHYTPLDSGLALLPMTLIMLLFSARSGALSARIGPRLQMSLGPVVAGAGLALLARATDHGSYWTQVFPAVIVFAAGMAITVAPLTATAMGAAPPEHSGVASAVNNTVARAASLFAVAVLPLAAGLTGAAGLAPEELAHGFRTAMYISGVTCAAGGLLAVLTIRNPARRPAEEAEVKCPYSCAVGVPPPRPLVTVADGAGS